MSDTENKQDAGKARADDDAVEDVRARSVAAMEEVEATEPTPSQAELDRMKSGEAHLEAGKGAGYKTRQSKPA